MGKLYIIILLINIVVLLHSLLHFATAAQFIQAHDKWQDIPSNKLQHFYDFIFYQTASMYYIVPIICDIIALYSIISSFLMSKKVTALSIEFYLILLSFCCQTSIAVMSGVQLVLFEDNLHILIYYIDSWNTLQQLLIAETITTFTIIVPIMAFLIYQVWMMLFESVKLQNLKKTITRRQQDYSQSLEKKKLKDYLSLFKADYFFRYYVDKGVNEPKLLKTIACCLLLGNGILHVIYGVQYIQLGIEQSITADKTQFYLNSLPFGSCCITIGLFLIFSMGLLACVMINDNLLSDLIENLMWKICWAIVVLNFSVGGMAIAQYTIVNKFYSIFEKDINLNSEIYKAQYYLSLVDGIISFVLGFPASLALMYYANYRLMLNGHRYRIQIIPQRQRQTLSLSDGQNTKNKSEIYGNKYNNDYQRLSQASEHNILPSVGSVIVNL